MAGKVCVVLGAGPGLGMAIARKFGSEGFSVALVARREDALQEITEQLKAEGVVQVQSYVAELAESEAVRATLEKVVKEQGEMTVLVYNAAAFRAASALTLTLDQLQNDLNVGMLNALVAVQSVYPAMKQAGEGTILLTGGGLALHPENGVEAASLVLQKTGIRALAYMLAPKLEADGIHLATVTIAGTIATGTPFAPDAIAATYWLLHTQSKPDWQREIVFDATDMNPKKWTTTKEK